jgi:hypothetical protein
MITLEDFTEAGPQDRHDPRVETLNRIGETPQFTVDIGKRKGRSAAIAPSTKEELLGRQVVVVANKPAMLMGRGMIGNDPCSEEDDTGSIFSCRMPRRLQEHHQIGSAKPLSP